MPNRPGSVGGGEKSQVEWAKREGGSRNWRQSRQTTFVEEFCINRSREMGCELEREMGSSEYF